MIKNYEYRTQDNIYKVSVNNIYVNVYNTITNSFSKKLIYKNKGREYFKGNHAYSNFKAKSKYYIDELIKDLT